MSSIILFLLIRLFMLVLEGCLQSAEFLSMTGPVWSRGVVDL